MKNTSVSIRNKLIIQDQSLKSLKSLMKNTSVSIRNKLIIQDHWWIQFLKWYIILIYQILTLKFLYFFSWVFQKNKILIYTFNQIFFRFFKIWTFDKIIYIFTKKQSKNIDDWCKHVVQSYFYIISPHIFDTVPAHPQDATPKK